jgi:hypothetical protein
MRYMTFIPIKFKNKELRAGETFVPKDENIIKGLLAEGKVKPVEEEKIRCWLDRLSESERDIYRERINTMQIDSCLLREQLEVELIKKIISDRVIKGKCDVCIKVNGCMLTRDMRPLCGGPFTFKG